jgi:hypothetical protein
MIGALPIKFRKALQMRGLLFYNDTPPGPICVTICYIKFIFNFFFSTIKHPFFPF